MPNKILFVDAKVDHYKTLFADLASHQAHYQSTLSAVTGVFAADNGANGTELWVTDGTAVGTHLLKDIYVSSYFNPASNPTNFTSLGNGKIVFSANDGINGNELWVTDGTAAGTHLVKDINTVNPSVLHAIR